MIKKLVAVTMMATIFVTPVFAKNGDMYYNETTASWFKEVDQGGTIYLKNHLTGELSKKSPMKRTYTYELHKAGDKQTVNVISKNGVAMVAVSELAEVFGLNFDEGKTHIEFFCYVTQEQDTPLAPSYALMLSKGNNTYKAETGEVKKVENMHGSWMENVVKEGTLKTPLQVVNGKTYVPAREVINLINQQETEIRYDEAAKTITFAQMREWYKAYPYEG